MFVYLQTREYVTGKGPYWWRYTYITKAYKDINIKTDKTCFTEYMVINKKLKKPLFQNGAQIMPFPHLHIDKGESLYPDHINIST